VCLCDFESGDEIRTLPCKHRYHKDCIDQWISGNGTCPVCRASVINPGTGRIREQAR
jgi:hypothetical protein